MDAGARMPLNAQAEPKGIYGVVVPEFAIIIPRIGDELILVEQFRYPVQQRSLEFPQGACDQPNIQPETLARQELKEETGFVADSMTHLSRQCVGTGFCNQWFNVFFATDLTQQSTDRDAEEEDLEIVRMSIREFEAKIMTGEIIDATTVNAFSFAKMRGCCNQQPAPFNLPPLICPLNFISRLQSFH